MFPKLIKATQVSVHERQLLVRYYEGITGKGSRRYSSEIVLSPDDRIILDDDSMDSLESRVARLLPATVYSHFLAARVAA